MNLSQAVNFLIEQLIELAPDGAELPEIASVEFITGDDDRDVTIRVHLAEEELNGGCPVHAAFDVADEHREHVELSLTAASALHRALHKPAACEGVGRGVLPAFSINTH